jgi:hypothetical protein
VVRKVPVDVQRQPLDPGREVDVHGGVQAAIDLVPVRFLLPAS